MDVHNSFLQDDIFKNVCIVVAPSFYKQGRSSKFYKLHKFFYRLKQAPGQLNLKLTQTMIQLRYVQTYFFYLESW